MVSRSARLWGAFEPTPTAQLLVSGLSREQVLIWCSRATAAEACEAVISVKHWDEGTNQGLFAGQALTAVMQHLEALGGRIDGVQAVPASQLPADCPAHLTTRVLLAREARRLR